MTRQPSRLSSPYVWLTLIVGTVALGAAGYVSRAPYGLHATYFAGPDWMAGPGTVTDIDSVPSTATLKRHRPDFAERPFSVEWRGFLLVPESGSYAFSLTSDDGSSLSIDDRLVADNPGRHGPVERRATVSLSAGAHPLVIRYFQDGGDLALVLRWGQEGGALATLSPSALARLPVSRARVLTRRSVDVLLWLIALAWVMCAAIAGVERLGRRISWRGLADPALLAVLGVSVPLNVWGVWWALPNVRGWAPDELVPADVLDGAAVWFSNGWFGKYPPLHYAVLTIAYAPMWIWSWLSGLDVREPTSYAVLFFVGRGVSVLCAVGVIAMVFQCGRELYGRTGAAFAALTAALIAPFVYYGKIANLEAPYLFWFSVSLWAYVRVLKSHQQADYLWFAVAAALAVCTKDQAYGLFALTPLAILVARRRHGLRMLDRTTVVAGAAGIATFVVAGNLLFNLSGYVAHVRVITGPASADYQMFAGTVAGQFEMATSVAREMLHLFGWPLAIVVLASLGWGLRRATTTPALSWLLVPVVGYYVTFLSVVLYFYDRFLLPIALVLAVVAGGGLEQFVSREGPARRLRRGLVGAAFLYSVGYAASVDLTLVNDSRIRVSEWVAARVGPGDIVAARGPLEYFMLAEGFATASVESIAHVTAVRPAFIVLNPWHIAHLPPGDRSRAMRDHLLDPRSGYRLALRYQTQPVPWPGRHPDLGSMPREPEWSSLGQLNPVLEIFAREP